MKICPNCQHANEPDVSFCENCGTKLTNTSKQCPRCQYANPKESRFCENCGYDFGTVSAANQTKPLAKQPEQPQQTFQPKSAEPTSQAVNQNHTATSTVNRDQSIKSTGTENTESLVNADQQAISSRPVSQAKPVTSQEVEVPKSVAAQPLGKATAITDQPKQSDEARATASAAGAPQTQSTTSVTPQPALRTATPKSKWPWLVALLVLLAVVGGMIYFLYSRPSISNTTTAKAPATHKAASRHSSSVAKREQSSSNADRVSFDTSKIKDDISTTVGSIGGTNSVYVSPVDSKQTVLVNNGSQRSASSIKIFIMVTAYAMAKDGVFNLEDTHTVTDSEKVGGTGVIQQMDAGTKLSYQEIIEHMIDDSDNTAANIMIKKLGGFQLINNKIKNMGATDTKLRRKMMDTKALDAGRDNTTSAYDMGTTLKKIYNHQLVSRQADEAMLAILTKNQNRTKLPKRLPSSATVYNKTGEYADYGVQNDAEIVKNSRGAFVAVVLSEDGEETDQVDAMNRLGLMLYQNILE